MDKINTMELNNCKINAKDLWDIMSIKEETEDHYGRKGRGITLVYFNKEYENTNFIPEDNLKKTILDYITYFQNEINKYSNLIDEEIDIYQKQIYIHNKENLVIIYSKFKQIFGEFENDTR